MRKQKRNLFWHVRVPDLDELHGKVDHVRTSLKALVQFLEEICSFTISLGYAKPGLWAVPVNWLEEKMLTRI